MKSTLIGLILFGLAVFSILQIQWARGGGERDPQSQSETQNLEEEQECRIKDGKRVCEPKRGARRSIETPFGNSGVGRIDRNPQPQEGGTR